MPKVQEKKTLDEYGKLFCELMNGDERIKRYTNMRLAGFVKDASIKLFEMYKAHDAKASGKVLGDAVNEIMSFAAFLYAKAREIEDKKEANENGT